MDPIKNLNTYMLNYPGNFVGFFADVSVILKSLSTEWNEYGRKDLGEVFQKSSDQVMEVAANLSIAQNIFTEEQKSIADVQG